MVCSRLKLCTISLVSGVIGASLLCTARRLILEHELTTIWIIVLITLVIIAMVTIIKTFVLALRIHVIFIDMPDPDNYAAVLLRAYQSKVTNSWLAVVGRWVFRRLGLPLCPLYIVCGGRLVNLGLAHKNTNSRFFDESTNSWLTWDPCQHIGTLPADKAITCNYVYRETLDDSTLVLKKNMFDLDCILRTAGYSDFVLVKGHTAKQIPLSYSHHADEWRFYNNVKKQWVTSDEYDQLSDERCNESDKSQNVEQRRKLARQFINQLTGVSDFESSSTGLTWLSLYQLRALLFACSSIDITMAGPATDIAYLVGEPNLVGEPSGWTWNVKQISAMWAVCELGTNTGKMNVCGMNFNEAADVHDAKYPSPNYFPNAAFTFLPTETCKLTPHFKVTHKMAEGIEVLQCLADKIALWTHIKGGHTDPLFDYFICESPDITASLHSMGLVKVFVIPNTTEGYMILSPSAKETACTAWVNPSEMFKGFTWGQNKIYFNGTHWSNAKIVG